MHSDVGDEATNLQVEELLRRGAHDHVLGAAVIDLATTRFRPYLVDVCVVFDERVATELVLALFHRFIV